MSFEEKHGDTTELYFFKTNSNPNVLTDESEHILTSNFIKIQNRFAIHHLDYFSKHFVFKQRIHLLYPMLFLKTYFLDIYATSKAKTILNKFLTLFSLGFKPRNHF